MSRVAPSRALNALDSAEYLGGDDVIEVSHPEVRALSARLRAESASGDDAEFARIAFEWVRDQIAHSADAADPRVTVTASQVLREGVGLCFAKSHLLAAILRAEGIPAGLCYQRLGDETGGYVLHGLVAVYLSGGWHRQDPRGNKPGIDAQFSLGRERLAYTPAPERGEADYPEVRVAPAPAVITALRSSSDALALCETGLPTVLD
jgi:transglutaminase-like putative cysteine protease